MKNIILKKSLSLYLLYKLFCNLHKPRRRQIYALLFVNLASAFFETISLGSLFPFLGFLLNPDAVINKIPRIISNFLLNFNTDIILTFFTAFFIVATIISVTLRVFNLWLNSRIAASIGSDFSSKAFQNILNSSYSSHIKMDSNKNFSTLTIHINQTVYGINAFLRMITFSIISLSIIILLLFINFYASFLAAILLTFAYLILGSATKKILKSNSNDIANSTKEKVSIIREGFQSIKDITLDYSQNKYLKKYITFDIPMRRNLAQSIFLATSPRYIMELLGIIFIAGLAWFLTINADESANSIPVLGTIALGAQRLLPSLQQIYQSWSEIRNYNADMKNLLDLLAIPDNKFNINLENYENFSSSDSFKKYIKFENVSFSYGNELPMVLDNLNFTIFKGEKIGIIGTTGSGKSTLIDLILTLLSPTKGRIYLDDKEISTPKQILKWRKSIAHVPQTIFLHDDTIANNISMKIDENIVNYDKIKKAADAAQLTRICNNFDNKFDTLVGENGVNLSGGQKQRIGIARALYKNSQVLVLDEATSALDFSTENLVMKSISKLNRKITIILVTHRLDSIKFCDRVFQIEKGKLVKIGTATEILKELNKENN